MESEEATSIGARRTQWLFMRARLALALAIIRNKPPGTSGREYTEVLARRLKDRHESRKRKAEGLRLRQEELITKLTSLAEAAESNGRMNENSQDLFGPESAEPEPDLDSETPDLQLSPNPEPASNSSASATASDHHALRHIRFLQSLGSLQRLKGGGGMEAVWFGPYNDGVPVLEDTLSELLDFVVEGKGSITQGTCDLTVAACQAAARGTDLLGSRKSAELTSRVGKQLKELTRMLLRGDQSGGLRAAEDLKRCMMLLANSSMLKSLLIRHIMSELSALTDQLWQVIQVADASGLQRFPLSRYQNSCHLFSVLEELLPDSDTSWREEAGPELRDFQRCLEERVFPLSEEFHLFSLRMWRLGGLVKDPTTPLSRRRKHRR